MSIFTRKAYINEAEVVYELKVGGHYLIEYRDYAVLRRTIVETQKALREKDIHVIFIANSTPYRAFEPIPATPNKVNLSN